MTQTMRRGRVYQRCTTCGADVKGTKHKACAGKRSSWAFTVDLAAPGEPRKQVGRMGFATKADAVAALTKLQASKGDGSYVEPTRRTVGDYLTAWLEAGGWLDRKRRRVSPGTYDARAYHVRHYLIPEFGAERLQTLTPERVMAGYASIQRRREGLSDKSVYNVHTTFSRALDDAVVTNVLPRNPAARTWGRPQSPEQQTWTAEQLRTFYVFAAEDRLFALWRLASSTGLRRGELAGLRWRDVNLDAGMLAVVQQRAKGGGTVSAQQTKGKRGRPVPLDPQTVAVLRKHSAQQAQERLAWGPAWQDSGLVFVHEDGTPLHPDSITKRFKRLVRDAGLPWVKLHGLRHTHATLMLEAGVHPRVVQERLGHSDIAITLGVYSHVTPTMQHEAAAKVAAIVDGGP